MKSFWKQRTLALGVLGVVVALALALPAVACATPGDFDNPVAVPALPWSQDQTGTLNLTTDDGESWGEFDYLIPLTKGKTYTFTYTTPANDNYAAVMSPTFSPAGMIFSDSVGFGVERITFMAPASMSYLLSVAADQVETFTVSGATVPSVACNLSSFSVPSSKKKAKSFPVSVAVSPRYNSLGSPITFEIQRKVGKRWKKYSTAKSSIGGLAPSYSKFSASIKIKAKGSFRIRAKFADAAHVAAKYTKYKTIKIK